MRKFERTGTCRRDAECNSAIQQITNLRYAKQTPPSGRGRTIRLGGDETGVIRIFAGRAELFPLPEGEGKGEGEQSELWPAEPRLEKLSNGVSLQVKLGFS